MNHLPAARRDRAARPTGDDSDATRCKHRTACRRRCSAALKREGVPLRRTLTAHSAALVFKPYGRRSRSVRPARNDGRTPRAVRPRVAGRLAGPNPSAVRPGNGCGYDAGCEHTPMQTPRDSARHEGKAGSLQSSGRPHTVSGAAGCPKCRPGAAGAGVAWHGRVGAGVVDLGGFRGFGGRHRPDATRPRRPTGRPDPTAKRTRCAAEGRYPSALRTGVERASRTRAASGRRSRWSRGCRRGRAGGAGRVVSPRAHSGSGSAPASGRAVA